MLEKYLNKEIIVEEKLFNSPSTFKVTGNKIYGGLTGYDIEHTKNRNITLHKIKVLRKKE